MLMGLRFKKVKIMTIKKLVKILDRLDDKHPNWQFHSLEIFSDRSGYFRMDGDIETESFLDYRDLTKKSIERLFKNARKEVKKKAT